MSSLERPPGSALRLLRSYRDEIETKRQIGGYDEEALVWAEWYLDQCEQALADGDLGVVLVYHATVVKHLAWARGPILERENFRERQRMVGHAPRSVHKERALDLYARRRPHSLKEFEDLLRKAKIPTPLGGAARWFTEARKRNRT